MISFAEAFLNTLSIPQRPLNQNGNHCFAVQAKNELKTNLQFDDEEAKHLLITLRQVSGLGVSDRIQVPEEVIEFANNQPIDISKFLPSERDPINIFSLLNSNIRLSKTAAFDLSHQIPESFNQLLKHIQVVAAINGINEAWILIPTEVNLGDALESAIELLSMDFMLGKIRVNNRQMNAYFITLRCISRI